MDLSSTHNPYDFANPVSDEGLFVGRREELEEIRYYLDHARTGPRPINPAILGARASGKTSLLNMIDVEAKKRDFLVVRIDLDEDDAKTQLAFFFKVFDGILAVVCEHGGFGGKEGKTYDAYLDMVNAYKVPHDKTFCTFVFPVQYAKAAASGNFSVPLSDHNFRADLARLRGEAGRPVLLLFDEGNVLAGSRVVLEKLRNIFMNTPGFMLVLTGTPDLFPLMDEVFSPIVRQFKKIAVREFKSRDETQECIRRPLERIGVGNLEEVFDFETLRDVNEIHDLSGGRPFEIQLICHMLFRRVQARKAKMMKLSLSVLEDVRRELETSQDVSSRPILSKIRNMGSKQLRALNLLCRSDGVATFDQVWRMEYVFNGELRWTKQALEEELHHLTDQGVIVAKEERLNFVGDDFDRIYVKYFAREQRVQVGILDVPLELALYFRVQTLAEKGKGVGSFHGLYALRGDVDIGRLAESLGRPQAEEDLFSTGPPFVEELYSLMIDYQGRPVVPVVGFNLSFPWATIHTWHYATDPKDVRPLEICLERLASLRNRAEEVGASVEVGLTELPVAPLEVLAEKVDRTENEMLRRFLSLQHFVRMVGDYINGGKVDEAVVHGRLAYRYNRRPEPRDANNLGYLLLRVGDLRSARELLELAVSAREAKDKAALASYNLAILECMEGNFPAALLRLGECLRALPEIPPDKRHCACLLAPRNTEGSLTFEEVKDPDLLTVAGEAGTILASLARQT